MESVLIWLGRRVHWASLLALPLLTGALGIAAVGLGARVRGLDLFLMLGVTWLGMAAGWTLSHRTLGPGAAAGAALLSGSLVDAGLVGQLGGPMLNAVGQLSRYSVQLWHWRYQRPEFELAGAALLDLLTRLNTLFVRLRDWLSSILQGQPAYDPVAVTLAWVLAAWLVGWWAGWSLQRNRPLPALLPSLGLLAFVNAYSGGLPAYLLIALAASFLLMVIGGQRAREARWEATQVDYSEDIRVDAVVAGAAVTLVLVVLAGVAPNLSIQAVADRIRDFTSRADAPGNSLPQSLGLQPAPRGESAFDSLRNPGLPRQHLIGSGPELSRRVVMTVTPADPALRYYWRSATYDKYTGHGWLTTGTETTAYGAGVRLVEAALPGQRPAQLDVSAVEPLGDILYYPGSLVTASTEFSAAWRSKDDLFSASTAAPYRVESLVADPAAAELRLAPAVHPDSRYLALPDSVPQRVLNLARDITVAPPTAYDRAKALEAYVRSYPYTLDLPAPPPAVDIVDYFLFDLKRGYCDYDATSMVVLARAAGLPARLVTGYASGAFDSQAGRFVVTEADAHSWVEIYFTGYGWVEFEPTGGLPELERSNEARPTPSVEPTLPPAAGGAAPDWPWPAILLGSLAGAILGLSAWLWLDRIHLARLSPAQTSQVLFQRLRQAADRLALGGDAGDTPYEFSQALAEGLAGRRVARPNLEVVRWLIGLYVRACYSRHPPDGVEQLRAIRAWDGLRWPLWRARYVRPTGAGASPEGRTDKRVDSGYYRRDDGTA